MKAGQIVKVTPKALNKFAPGIRKRLEGAIGLVVQEKYDLSYRLEFIDLFVPFCTNSKPILWLL